MKYSISEICEINKFSLKKNDVRKKIRYLDTANLNQNIISKLVTYNLNVDKIPSRAKRIVRPNDILISTVRPNKLHYGLIDNPVENLIASTGFAVLSPNTKKVNPTYLYILLTLPSTTNILQKTAENSTSTYPSIKPTVISELMFDFPMLEIQKKIGDFYKSCSKKIELNNQIINTLEETATTLFNHWFIDFEFPDKKGNPYKSSGGKMIESELGEIPEEWTVGKISDLGQVIGGGTPSKKKEEYYLKGGIPWITPKDLSIQKSVFISNGKLDITELGLSKSSAKLMPKGTILFSSRAPVGYVAIASNDLSTNQGFKSIVPNKKILTEFLYLFLKKNVSKIESMASGSTFKEVSGTVMKNIKLIIPNDMSLIKFKEIVYPIFCKIEQLEKEIKFLEDTRDTLLPKLLSGEIELE
ncbi:type I restriction enzyme, S subunit [Enterococcus sp. DIV0784]|uniref:restriction endonuclease subunit S n=1 Tax=unclassified Enterococcus TaxID=2608891 RepID=UPI003F237632